MNALQRLGLVARNFPWYHFIARSGEPGRRWAEAFTGCGGDEITGGIDDALVALRRHRMDEGKTLLDRGRQRIDALADVDAAVDADVDADVLHVLERWYQSALAYYHYLEGDQEAAERDFAIAQQHIADTVDGSPHLVMVGNHAYDFRLQHARIARQQRNWRAMAEHIGVGRAMLENRHPLCVLRDGSGVFIEQIDAFYRAIEPEGAEETAAITSLLDTTRRRQTFESFVKDNYALPGLVIPYQRQEHRAA